MVIKKIKLRFNFWQNRQKLFLFCLILVGSYYRFHGLKQNYSFWTDEEHVAIFSRAILEKGRPILENGYSTGLYQWLQYYLSAFSAKVFSLNEFAIRFPSVIFGVLTIWAVYLLARELFNKNVALVAGFFTAFLNIEILMSRQARPYQALQFFYLSGAWFVYKLAKEEKFNWYYFLGFLGCGVLASLMHGLGLIIFFPGIIYLFLKKPLFFKSKKGLVFLLSVLPFVYFFKNIFLNLFHSLGEVNNLYYYRVFLSHNYLLLLILAFLGALFCFRKRNPAWQLPTFFLVVQILAISFLLGQPFTRYFYPVFPFLIILSSFSLVEISKVFKRFNLLALGLLILLVIFATPDKFSFLPKDSFSLNEDMSEIPEVDYKKIYAFIKPKLVENPEAIYISNWSDHAVWYLGEGSLDYLLRNNPNNLEADVFSEAEYISSVGKLEKVIKESKKGLILLESWESEFPEGAREFIRESMHKEFEVDRLYPVQPRYWPIEIYSWGIN